MSALRETLARTSARVAYAAAGVNLAAGLAMLLVLRPGLPVPGSTPLDRLAFVRANLGLWWGGWLVWQLAAITLLAFYVALAARWYRQAPIRCVLALLCAGAGLAADLTAEAFFMSVAPRLDPQGFALVEIGGGVLTGYLGNGLYTVAGILLVWAGAHELPRPLLLLSLPVWAAGLALSAATLTGSTDGQTWTTAILMPTFVLWTAVAGRWLQRRAS